MGVGRVSVFDERDGARMMEEFFYIELQGDGGVFFNVKVDCQLLTIEVVVVSEVVNEASEFFFGIPVFPFECEKDVAVFPAPMELTEVGIQGMIVGVLIWFFVVCLLWDSDRKAGGPVGSGGDIREREGGASLSCVEVGVLIGKFVPFSVIRLKGKGAEKVAQSGDRKCFTLSIADRVEQERLAFVLVVDVDPDISSNERRNEDKKKEDDAHLGTSLAQKSKMEIKGILIRNFAAFYSSVGLSL